jgi:hypothetical protein
MLDRRPFKRLSAALAALALTPLFACASGPAVSTAFDPLTRFPAEASFVWDVAANHVPDDPRIAALNFEPRLRKLTTDALAARGYREVESEPADYRASYQLSVHTWISTAHSTSVGSLSIVLVDSVSGRRVWTGFTHVEAQVGLPEEMRNERLRDILYRMFENFPPNSGG